jgi:hypothetical protein
VVEGGEYFGFSLEAGESFWIFSEYLRQNLESYLPLQRCIFSPIDLSRYSQIEA